MYLKIKEEKWDEIFECFKKNSFLRSFLIKVLSLRKEKDFSYERELLDIIESSYFEIYSKIEGEEIFFLFYLRRIYQLKILYMVLNLLENGFDLGILKEICLV
ncbi:MAG: hypothetical protein DRI36_01060 [Caldiserica bacterium]|nr:MAG: hypothetical protein DRI36_01060 [Caldisericota bacterium]